MKVFLLLALSFIITSCGEQIVTVSNNIETTPTASEQKKAFIDTNKYHVYGGDGNDLCEYIPNLEVHKSVDWINLCLRLKNTFEVHDSDIWYDVACYPKLGRYPFWILTDDTNKIKYILSNFHYDNYVRGSFREHLNYMIKTDELTVEYALKYIGKPLNKNKRSEGTNSIEVWEYPRIHLSLTFTNGIAKDYLLIED